MRVLKVAAPDVRPKPFTPQGEAGSCLPVVCLHTRGGFYCEIMYQPLLPVLIRGFFLVNKYKGVAQLASAFPSEGIVPYVAICVVCLWEKISSRVSLMSPS